MDMHQPIHITPFLIIPILNQASGKLILGAIQTLSSELDGDGLTSALRLKIL